MVELPSELRREGLARELEAAIRGDPAEASEESAKLTIYSRSELRSLSPSSSAACSSRT